MPDDEDELDDDESNFVMCPHGYTAANECPRCDDPLIDLEDEQGEKCQILLDHAMLAGCSRDLLEKMLRDEGCESDVDSMEELFQMHISTILQYEKSKV